MAHVVHEAYLEDSKEIIDVIVNRSRDERLTRPKSGVRANRPFNLTPIHNHTHRCLDRTPSSAGPPDNKHDRAYSSDVHGLVQG